MTGIPTERLLRLLRSLTQDIDDAHVRYGWSAEGGGINSNLDTEDLATLVRIVSGERWQDYPCPINVSGGWEEVSRPGSGDSQ